VAPTGFEAQSAVHVSLRDETRAAITKWAWDAGRSLVEAHSHGDAGSAEFSASDLCGFAEWVPHLWWRLRGRPYAAIVTAGETFDALAWIVAPQQPEQVRAVDITGRGRLIASGRTLATRARRAEAADAS
jgi:hypothetical protein